MSKNILLIQFSSRKQGNCAAISAQIAAHYAADTVAQFSADEKVVQPCNNCNYECLLPGKLCPNLNDAHNQLMDAICKADLVYFIIPNYCGYPCASYFAYNERIDQIRKIGQRVYQDDSFTEAPVDHRSLKNKVVPLAVGLALLIVLVTAIYLVRK